MRATTHAGYERNVAKLKGGLGHVRLADLRPVMIERLYAELAATGGRGGTPLSAKSVVNVHPAEASCGGTGGGWGHATPATSPMLSLTTGGVGVQDPYRPGR